MKNSQLIMHSKRVSVSRCNSDIHAQILHFNPSCNITFKPFQSTKVDNQNAFLFLFSQNGVIFLEPVTFPIMYC